MGTKKIRNRNIEPHDLQCRTHGSGEFILEFTDYTKNTRVTINLKRWWIKYIARELWKVIHREKGEITRIEQSMQGE